MVSILKSVPIASVFLPLFAFADDDCTFSSSAMLESIERIAEVRPGASIDAEELEVTWILENGDVEYYSVGGCHDLGAAAGRVTQLIEKRSAEAVIRVALELAGQYLPDAEIDLVSDAMEGGSYDRGTNGSEDIMAIAHPFGEILITHRFAEGSDSVEISWPVL